MSFKLPWTSDVERCGVRDFFWHRQQVFGLDSTRFRAFGFRLIVERPELDQTWGERQFR
jgi:hypothetical protein